MSTKVRFPYKVLELDAGRGMLMPILPLRLSANEKHVEAQALLDTGSAVNVLPFALGEALGFNWNSNSMKVVLTGNLSRHPARAIVLDGLVEGFKSARLAFAWSRSDAVPCILGQVNFFDEFDACFFRAKFQFELRSKRH